MVEQVITYFTDLDSSQKLAPDPKCKLNISSFLTLPHPLDSFLCTKDIIIIVLLRQIMGDGKVGGGSVLLGFGWGKGLDIIFFLFFVLLLITLSLLVHDSCWVCFFVPFLLSFSLVPLIRCYYYIETLLFVL